MKKMKFIIPVVSCLLTTALFSCASKSEQPESDYYTISIANAHKSPKVLIEGSNLIKKGEACDMFIRVEPFTYLAPIPDYQGETVRICQANRIGYDIALDKRCYTFKKKEDDPCLYHLHINKEYMTTSYVVDINSCYVEGYDEEDIKIDETSSLNGKADITVVNTAVNSDLTFFVTPRDFQSGYTFDGVTKDAIKIIGKGSSAGDIVLTDDVTRNELVLCDSPIQGLGHYQTLTKQLRIALPMEKLFVEDSGSEFGYTQKFDSIEISSGLTDNPVAYNKENYEKIFYPTADSDSCELNGDPSIEFKEDGIHYVAKFTANTGYHFSTENSEDFSLTDLSILPNVYTPTGRPYFRDFEVHADPSKRKDIEVNPYTAYYGSLNLLLTASTLNDKNGNVYVPMGNPTALSECYWLNLITGSTDLKVDINISRMVKYVELPVSTIIDEYYLLDYDNFWEFYQDGSIDFIKSINFTVKAVQ